MFGSFSKSSNPIILTISNHIYPYLSQLFPFSAHGRWDCWPSAARSPLGQRPVPCPAGRRARGTGGARLATAHRGGVELSWRCWIVGNIYRVYTYIWLLVVITSVFHIQLNDHNHDKPWVYMISANITSMITGWFGKWLDDENSTWEVHHPNWRTHIFQRGSYTTNQNVVNNGDSTGKAMKPCWPCWEMVNQWRLSMVINVW